MLLFSFFSFSLFSISSFFLPVFRYLSLALALFLFLFLLLFLSLCLPPSLPPSSLFLSIRYFYQNALWVDAAPESMMGPPIEILAIDMLTTTVPFPRACF